jgi:hypothetical protein
MTTKPYASLDHIVYITTYDDKVFPLQGKPDADYILIEFQNEPVDAVEGVDGDVQYSLRTAKMANWTMTNQWGADWNDYMNQAHEDQASGNYLKKIELKRINQTTNISIAEGQRPMIKKIPNYQLGAKAADRAWIVVCEKTDMKEKQTPA